MQVKVEGKSNIVVEVICDNADPPELCIWKEWFYYDETSPSGLMWKKDRFVGRQYKTLLCKKGTRAGSKRADGYWAVKLFNKTYKCHRIIYSIVTNSTLDTFVDHIDGNTSNNVFTNLRKVDHKTNCKNRGKFRNNTTGKTGVTRLVNKSGNCYWVAQWRQSGKHFSKCFSVLKLGEEEAFYQACAYREEMIEQLGNYTERHKHDI